jgi:quercetin dioxygenase-like cupin family protein
MARKTEIDDGRGHGGLKAGSKQNLASLISYGTGSVVSRTIVQGQAGTVTLFAFDEGEGLSPHTAPFDALLYLLEGKALVTISGKSSELGEGEAIILPAGKPHAVKAVTRFKMLLVMIRKRPD